MFFHENVKNRESHYVFHLLSFDNFIPESTTLIMTTKIIRQNTSGNAVYGLGLIGAAIYYISHATGFWMGVIGVLKSLVWPAFLVFEALKYLGA
jgi:hypothetical protein